MNIHEECIGCIINQSIKVSDAIDAHSALREEITSKVGSMSKNFSYSKTPPEIAADVYEQMAQIAKKVDLYDELKARSTKHALSFKPSLEQLLQTTQNRLLTATKIAVAGNVIDLAAQVEFDLEEELSKVFETEFAHNDFELLASKLATAKNVVVLGDNVGEHIFDAMFIEVLKELFPDVEYSYFVRGVPIINDVTLKEAQEAGFDRLCNLVDSGVNTPGFDYARASDRAKELFDSADIVISKGMGNYECLSPSHRDNICFLLKVKCQVVASSLGQEVGDIICKIV